MKSKIQTKYAVYNDKLKQRIFPLYFISLELEITMSTANLTADKYTSSEPFFIILID